jgi:hypothetical protein
MVQKTSDGIPHLLRGPTLPKFVQYSLVLARPANRAKGVDIARDSTMPNVDRHDLVPHLPHQKGFFLLSFVIPHAVPLETKICRKRLVPFLSGQL